MIKERGETDAPAPVSAPQDTPEDRRGGDPPPITRPSFPSEAQMNKYQIMPPLAEKDYRQLKASMRKSGWNDHPALIDDHGNVIDGHHRLQAWRELIDEGAVEGAPQINVVPGLSEEDCVAMAAQRNITRRQLNRPQIHEIIKKVMTAQPNATDRKIGEMVGVDHKTVGKVRKAAKAGQDGVQQRKPARPTKPAPAQWTVPGTGEDGPTTATAREAWTDRISLAVDDPPDRQAQALCKKLNAVQFTALLRAMNDLVEDNPSLMALNA